MALYRNTPKQKLEKQMNSLFTNRGWGKKVTSSRNISEALRQNAAVLELIVRTHV